MSRRNPGLVDAAEVLAGQVEYLVVMIVRDTVRRAPTDVDTERALRLLRKASALVSGAQRSLQRSVGDTADV